MEQNFVFELSVVKVDVNFDSINVGVLVAVDIDATLTVVAFVESKTTKNFYECFNKLFLNSILTTCVY